MGSVTAAIWVNALFMHRVGMVSRWMRCCSLAALVPCNMRLE